MADILGQVARPTTRRAETKYPRQAHGRGPLALCLLTAKVFTLQSAMRIFHLIMFSLRGNTVSCSLHGEEI